MAGCTRKPKTISGEDDDNFLLNHRIKWLLKQGFDASVAVARNERKVRPMIPAPVPITASRNKIPEPKPRSHFLAYEWH